MLGKESFSQYLRMKTTSITSSLPCIPTSGLLRLICKVIKTPMYRGINCVRAEEVICGIVASSFHQINLATSWPSAIDRVLRHHPGRGQIEVSCLTGGVRRAWIDRTYQIAGHSHCPGGILATTSTRPYLMVFLPLVVIRAERTGLIIVEVVALLVLTQSVEVVSLEVQVPAAVRLRV